MEADDGPIRSSSKSLRSSKMKLLAPRLRASATKWGSSQTLPGTVIAPAICKEINKGT